MPNNLLDIQQFRQINNLELLAKHIVEGFLIGLHRSPFRGFSVEFAEHRIYNSGESTKHIDWKLFARTDKLFVKKYEEETNLRSYIVIDSSSSMLFPHKEKKTQTKLAFSVFCGAALIHLLKKQRDAVGLSLFADDIYLKTRSKLSTTHLQMLFAELSKLLESVEKNTIPPQKNTNVANSLHILADSIPKRALIIVFSDMFDHNDPSEIFSALQHLRHKKHEVILFHVIDRNKEEKFQYHNRPYRFVDMESGEDIKFNPNEIREEYVKSIANYFNDIKLKCGQYNIDLVEVDINASFNDVLLSYLIKRKKMF